MWEKKKLLPLSNEKKALQTVTDTARQQQKAKVEDTLTVYKWWYASTKSTAAAKNKWQTLKPMSTDEKFVVSQMTFED